MPEWYDKWYKKSSRFLYIYCYRISFEATFIYEYAYSLWQSYLRLILQFSLFIWFQEYVLEVWRTPDIDTRWTVSHRYSDFAQLQSTLKVGSMVLPQLPPKKVFGNTDRDFINERKVALQVTSWWNYDEFFSVTFYFLLLILWSQFQNMASIWHT